MKYGVLFLNLGTPKSPSVKDVRNYLGEFLMDPYVISVPKILRTLIVKGFILPFRPKKSAEAYAKIWTSEGSPLLFHTKTFAQKMRELLSPHHIKVEFGMRYGSPHPKKALQSFQDAGIDQLLVVPLYPQYALSSFETAKQQILSLEAELKPTYKIEFFPAFYKEPFFVDSLADSIRPFVNSLGTESHLLFSYHGLPESHIQACDKSEAHCLKKTDCCEIPHASLSLCYRAQCVSTTQYVAQQLSLNPEQYSYSFQSRLTSKWIQPFTDQVIVALAKSGKKRLVVVTPSFVADCLETLEEIGIRAKEDFIKAGGKELITIPCLNSQSFWVERFTNRLLQACRPISDSIGLEEFPAAEKDPSAKAP